MAFRITKILLVALAALWITLVAFGNITDYGTNFAFVHHVLAMDTIFPGSGIHYRAIHSSALQHAAYGLIIASETLAALLCWLGAWRLWRARRALAAEFHRSKSVAAAGLSAGIAIWLGGFMVIGGEWFGMWMSSRWNGIPGAFRFTIVLTLVLIYLTRHDDEPEPEGGTP